MKYTPTEADRLTGLNVRGLRRKAGETAAQTLERSGLDLGQSSFSRIELGQRPLSLPEATKLAAHWNTTTDRIFVKAPAPVVTEQAFLGNEKPALFAVPDPKPDYDPLNDPKYVLIERDNPLTPDEYRVNVWVPYLEARYATEQKAG